MIRISALLTQIFRISNHRSGCAEIRYCHLSQHPGTFEKRSASRPEYEFHPATAGAADHSCAGFKTLYGSMDISFEHYRRYNKKDLKALIHGQNLRIVKFYYMNFLGLLGWFFNGRILKKKELPENQTKLFDTLVPFLCFAEK